MLSSRKLGRRTLVGFALSLTLIIAACGSSSSDGGAADTSGATDTSVGATDASGPYFIYLPPTPIGGNPFLELGWKGTQDAAVRLNGTSKMFESTDLNSRRANLEAAIEEKPAIIVMNTFDFTDLSLEFATANPDQKFILIDACPDAPPSNLACGVFREYEGAYLLGIMAGSLTKSAKIGSVVALDIPFLHRYSDSFALGAKSVNPKIADSQVFIGGDSPFTDPARAKEQALSLAAQGLDQIFAAGAGSNGGVFEAATEKGIYASGVDINECPKAPGHIVDNMIKLVNVVVEQLIDKVLAGTAENFNSFGLKEGGMGVLAQGDDVASSQCVIADHPEIITLVKAAAAKIISGELVIPDPLAG